MLGLWSAPLGHATSLGRAANIGGGAASRDASVSVRTSHPSWRSCRHAKESNRARVAILHRAAAVSRERDADLESAKALSSRHALHDDHGSAAQHQQQEQQGKGGRRRQPFGPEPPPRLQSPGTVFHGPPTISPDTGSSEQSVGVSGITEPVRKRRGRPPKQRASASADEQQQQQPVTTAASASVPAAEAAAAIVAAASAAAAGTAAAGSTTSTRRAFGPELPPPPSPANAANPVPSFALPVDPSALSLEDILDLPLPDPRVGERFRLDGDLSDMGDLSELGELGEAAAELAAGAGGNEDADDDDDADLDYDELIALASRVDAASYVARAFERAKQGLDPIADSNLVDVEAAPTANSEAAQAAAAAVSSTAGGRNSGDSAASVDRSSAASVAATAAAAAPPRVTSPAPASAGLATSPPPPTRGDAVYVDDEEVDDDTREADGIGVDGADGVSPEEEAAAQRRVALLVDLLSASGAELEAKLEAAAPEVDLEMLALLERRYTAALSMRQDPASQECIATLYRALRYIYERRTSSPAERLLDDVLGILADAQLQPDPARRRGEAAARLRNAFTGGMLDVDVFTAAAALAEGRQAAAEALAGEQVSLESFKAEAMGLLGHAKRVQEETISSLETIEVEVDRLRAEEPAALEGREWRVRMEQVRLARQALAEREESIGALEEVLALTRAVELQMLTGRMG